MTHPIWPIETRDGAHEPTPQVITWGSDAEHHAGNLGCDVAGWLHDHWVAVGHRDVDEVLIVGAWLDTILGSAGYAVEIQWAWQGARYNLRYGHGHEHMATRFPHIVVGASPQVGAWIGLVGVSGVYADGTPSTSGPHLHLAAAVGCTPGGRLESGQRYRADVLLAEIIASYEQEEPMTEEQKRLHDIGVRAEAHLPGQVGNLQNAIHATDGWAGWLESSAAATRKMRNQGGRELHDAAKSMRYVLTGDDQ